MLQASAHAYHFKPILNFSEGQGVSSLIAHKNGAAGVFADLSAEGFRSKGAQLWFSPRPPKVSAKSAHKHNLPLFLTSLTVQDVNEVQC